jgi:hypothetical protein
MNVVKFPVYCPGCCDGEDFFTPNDLRHLFYLVTRSILSLELDAEHPDTELARLLDGTLLRFEELYGPQLSPIS